MHKNKEKKSTNYQEIDNKRMNMTFGCLPKLKAKIVR